MTTNIILLLSVVLFVCISELIPLVTVSSQSRRRDAVQPLRGFDMRHATGVCEINTHPARRPCPCHGASWRGLHQDAVLLESNIIIITTTTTTTTTSYSYYY